MQIYEGLNKEQEEAVLHDEGPLLILAGAGSGKTRVLTHRIAHLIEERKVNPWNIMAITFTNKAAEEMRERVDKIVGFGSDSIWVATFHSTCVRMLRRFIDRLGYENNFTIYDTDDQKTLIKEVCKMLDIDTKVHKDRFLLSAISSAKNEMISPDKYEATASDWTQRTVAQVYGIYQDKLKKNNALDFDDLLVKTVELFEQCPDVLENFQERFRYIMVDEYQDTNTVQFKFVSLLAKKYKNLCVVGDDDQSIYKFRGANIANILNFEEVFPQAKVIKLEQNYRSTGNILAAANEVIQNNYGRKAKKLWTNNDKGSEVHFRQFSNGFEEAEYIVGEISRRAREGEGRYKDCAILYRTNAQSRLFEEKFLMANIPYRIVGGVNFYARKEIKDLLAYLKTVDNARDDVAVRRIINVPKRGIGATTIGKIQDYADQMDINFFEALMDGQCAFRLGKSATKIQAFADFIGEMRSKGEHISISELLNLIIDKTGYVKALEAEGTDEAQVRIENIGELITKVVSYEESEEQPTLSGLLEEVALIADIDSVDASDDHVLLMTLHSAKGLEFPYVYLAGMEDGMFPSFMAIGSDDPTDIEEERRLCYVGITRAMQDLTLCAAQQRMIRGETQYNKVSRFVHEIPRDYIDMGHEIRERKRPEIPVPNAYQQMKEAFKTKVFAPQQFKVSKPDSLEYEVGDTVKHIKFGVGIVKNIVEGGKDYEVTVDFDRVGVKKMFAGFAKLKKV